MSFKAPQSLVCVLAAVLAVAPQVAASQVALPAASPAAPLASPPAASAASNAPPAPTKVKLREGEELVIRFEDRLSSGTNTAGDQFSISLDEDMKLADGTVIRQDAEIDLPLPPPPQV